MNPFESDPLTPVTIDLFTCHDDHGGCLGRCDGKPLQLRQLTVQLPRSVLDLVGGLHLHISGEYTCDCDRTDMHYYLRDYDCLIAEHGHDFNAVMNRFAVKLAAQITKTRESAQQPVLA